MRSLHSDWIPAAVLLALVLWLAVSGAHLSSGAVLSAAGADITTEYLPWRWYAAHWVRQGIIPWWNPHNYCGVPFVANPETALFYPPNLIFLLLPVGVALNVSLLFHYWLTGFSCWLLASGLGLEFLPALSAGMVFMSCGANFLRIAVGHLSNACTVAWFPLVLLCVERIIATGRARWVGLGAVAYALMVLSGHLQYSAFCSLFAGLHALLRVFVFRLGPEPDRPAVRRIPQQLLGLASCVGIGLAIAGLQLSLTYQATLASNRVDARESFATSYSIPPTQFFMSLMPGFFGPDGELPYWGEYSPWEMSAYGGVAPLVLAATVLGLVFTGGRQTAPGRGATRSLATVGALCLGFSLGRNSPCYGALLRILPVFHVFRGPSKFLVPFSLVLALFCGFGFRQLMVDETRRMWRVLNVVFWTAVFAYSSHWVVTTAMANGGVGFRRWVTRTYPMTSTQLVPLEALIAPVITPLLGQHFNGELYRCWALLAATGLLCAGMVFVPTKRPLLAGLMVSLVLVDLLQAHGPAVESFREEVLAPHANLEQLGKNKVQEFRVYLLRDKAVSPDLAMTCGVLNPVGDASSFPRVIAQVLNAVNDRPYRAFVEGPRLGGLNNKTPVMGLRHIYHSSGQLDEDKRWLPRARLTDGARWFDSERAAWMALTAPGFDPVRELLLEGASGPIATGLGDPGSASLESETPNSVTITAQARHPTYLYLADTWADGWSATVDGTLSVILKANVGFRALALPAGAHRVVFTYAPPGLATGLVLTILGLVAAAGLIFHRDREN